MVDVGRTGINREFAAVPGSHGRYAEQNQNRCGDNSAADFEPFEEV